MSRTDARDSPHRIQLRRVKGWRKPEGALSVARPSRFGNPWRVVAGLGGTWLVEGRGLVFTGYGSKVEAATDAVRMYREKLEFLRRYGHGFPFTFADVLALAGRDLGCYCHLEDPCHAMCCLRSPTHSRPRVRDDGPPRAVTLL